MRKLIIPSLALILLALGCSKGTDTGTSSIGSGGSTGEGGSLAAMTLVGNYMYRIAGGSSVEVYDISKDSTATLVNTLQAGSGLETVFPFGKYLLMGTTSGMLIYDISNGANPQYVSTYIHIVSCDPVVAQGKYAYVTLRNGNRCNRGLTQLEVIDLSNIQQPQLINTLPMLMPHGLDADGTNLVVGEGDYGFKWFDLTDPTTPKQILFENTVPGFDIISRGNYFILVGAKGLYQYEYGNKKLNLLSVVPITQP